MLYKWEKTALLNIFMDEKYCRKDSINDYFPGYFEIYFNESINV